MKPPLVRRLLIDIETSPRRGWFWDHKHPYSIIHLDNESQIISVAYKWIGERQVYVKALPDFARYKSGIEHLNDYHLVKHIHSLFNEADLIIAHNGDRFDVKRINGRLIFHGFDPPLPYKTADTLKMHRAVADVHSHKLDYLAQHYGIGKKIVHTGKELWFGCLNGNKDDWAHMKRYNAHDVRLMEPLYLRLLPWTKTYPNLNLVHGTPRNCPRCFSLNVIKWSKLYSYTRTQYKQRYRCKDCGATCSGEAEKLPSKVVFH